MIETVITRKGADALPIRIMVHPSLGAKAVIVNCPGYRGNIDGFNKKYRTLGAHLSSRGFAFVQMPNIERTTTKVSPRSFLRFFSNWRSPVNAYSQGLIADLQAVIEWVIENQQVTGALLHTPVYLMGFSAGGFAVASVAALYPSVATILLMEPSSSASLLGPLDTKALSAYRGDVYVVVGDHDAVGPQGGEVYVRAFTNATSVKMVIVPECDHQFRGRVNGQILAKAPLWAFEGDTTFPGPEDGLVLY